MSVKTRKAIHQISTYVPAKSLESVKRELGVDTIIKLAGNENPLGYSPKVKTAIQSSFEELAYYPDMNCTVLKDKLSKILSVNEKELIFGNGSFELISIVAQTYLEEGDEAIFIDPSFNWYKNATMQMGAEIVSVPLKNFHTDLSSVKEKINSKTKLIWLCNPNNPVGTIITNKELTEFLNAIPKDIVVVSDEAYIDFVQEENYPDSIKLIHKHENLIILRTFSKIYGLASFRIGYGIATEEIIDALNKVRIPINVNSIAQVAASVSLDDLEFKERVLENNKRGIELYYHYFNHKKLEYVKTNCNFILFNTELDSNWVAAEFLKRGIIIRAGTEFGLPTWVRVTIGKFEENELVIKILDELL